MILLFLWVRFDTSQKRTVLGPRPVVRKTVHCTMEIRLWACGFIPFYIKRFQHVVIIPRFQSAIISC